MRLPKGIRTGNSQGEGASILTPSGLVAVSPGTEPLISQNALIFYNSKSYSVNFGAQPFRNAQLTAGYFNSLGGTTASSTAAESFLPGGQNFFYGSKWLQGSFVYHFRKLAFSAQFIQFTQNTSLETNQSAARSSAYSFGVSRSFHVF